MANLVDINTLEKGTDYLVFSWEVDKTAGVGSFNLYVSTDATGLVTPFVKVQGGIRNSASQTGYAPRSVVAVVKESAIKAFFPTAEVSITPLYFRATTVTTAGVESPVGSAKTKSTMNTPSAPSGRLGTQHGASFVSSSILNDDNICVDRTIVGGNVTEEVYYLAGAASGSRAKKVVYTAPFSTDGKATKVRVFDVVIP